MPESEYILFCDESDSTGKYFSNFYGGVMVGASQYQRVTDFLNSEKQRLGFYGEVKWSKVTELYRDRYIALIKSFFREVAAGHLRVRIMFTQNALAAKGLTREQINSTYFRLYYQFAKHAFGLRHRPVTEGPARLRLYFDEFPETRESVAQFRGFILGLQADPLVRRTGLTIKAEDIAEVRSHDHVLAQCLDLVLGSMSFRLNDKHLEKPAGSRKRGKKTIAKEAVYKAIYNEIRAIRSHFNIGISTGTDNISERWSAPYRHWLFVPAEREYKEGFTKPRNKGGPTQPT